MSQPRMKFAQLDETSLKRLQSLEEAYGAVVLAVQPEYPLAELKPEQLVKVQELERELGVVLIAYKL